MRAPLARVLSIQSHVVHGYVGAGCPNPLGRVPWICD